MSNLNEGASKELRKRIGEFECDLVKIMVEDPDWLLPMDLASLRWALSLARLTKINLEPKIGSEVVYVEHATDRYRALLFAILSQSLGSNGHFDKNLVAISIKKITAIAKKERLGLLSLFTNLSPKALDDAVKTRPLALILSGGGGCGYVYAGAFFAMEDANITPNIIAASSMGAVLGAYRARDLKFSFEALNALVAKTSWSKVAQPFLGQSRFGVPATFRLYLREVVGQEFLIDDRFLCLKDLAIPLIVCVAGLSSSSQAKKEDLEKFAHLFEAKKGIPDIKAHHTSIITKILEFAQKPLKAIYLGLDDLTKEFDVLDAIGFSSAIPGVFHYDILRDDPRMIEIATELFKREKVTRLIDGGFVDNLPTKEAISAVDKGMVLGFDPFVLALDCFTPSLSKHWLFYPLMLFAMDNAKKGHELAHYSIRFKNVLSPIHFVPTKESFQYAVRNGHEELKPHLSFIRKMLGPLPRPSFID